MKSIDSTESANKWTSWAKTMKPCDESSRNSTRELTNTNTRWKWSPSKLKGWTTLSRTKTKKSRTWLDWCKKVRQHSATLQNWMNSWERSLAKIETFMKSWETVKKSSDFQVYRRKRLWTNSTNTKKDLDTTQNKSKTSNAKSNNLFLKTTLLGTSLMEHKKISDSQPSNNKNFSMSSISTRKGWRKTTLSLKLTDKKFKNYWIKTTSLEIKSETLRRISGFLPPKSESSTMSSRSPAMSTKSSRESSKNSVAMPQRKFLSMNPRLHCFRKKSKDSMVSLNERTTKSEPLEVKFKVPKRILGFQLYKLPSSLKSWTNTKPNSKLTIQSQKPTVKEFKSFWLKIISLATKSETLKKTSGFLLLKSENSTMSWR